VFSIREFLAKHSIPVFPHLPYLPDLALCNFLPQAEDHPEGEEISTHCANKTNYSLAGAGHSRI